MSEKLLTIRMKADEVAEVLLYDTIGESFWGDGISAKTFREQIKGVKAKTLSLRINSPGGSVTEGAAMLAVLDDWRAKAGRRIEVDVDGLAASAASVVMMAGNVVRVASNGLVMIHDPYTMVAGGAAEMRHTADLLDKVKGQILDTYLRRAKLSRDELSAAMEAETWYTGQEAVDAGLADSIAEQVSVAAFAGVRPLLAKMKFKNAPELPTDAAAWAETERRKLIAAGL
jgi:ATP-dependent Clp protease protease subunit